MWPSQVPLEAQSNPQAVAMVLHSSESGRHRGALPGGQADCVMEGAIMHCKCILWLRFSCGDAMQWAVWRACHVIRCWDTNTSQITRSSPKFWKVSDKSVVNLMEER